MQRPAPFQGGAHPAAAPAPNASDRNEVWERKREAFFLAQNSRHPASPLGQPQAHPAGLPVPHNDQSDQMHPPNSAALPPSNDPYSGAHASSSAPGNPANFQQEWENSVAERTGRYQQQNDPSLGPRKKPTGYCVTKPPGGHSSIDLGWQEPANEARASGLGRGAQPQQQNPSVHGQQRHPPPFATADEARAPAQFHGRGQSQERGLPLGGRGGPTELEPTQFHSRGQPHQQESAALPRGRGGHGSQGNLQNASPYSWEDQTQRAVPAAAPGSYGAPPPPQYQQPHQQQHYGNDVRQANNPLLGGQTASTHGSRLNSESSNRFACGDSQNCGNVITERSSTRIAAPPGGHSNFSFY